MKCGTKSEQKYK